MYENALDWEHLPHLHGSSFASIACVDAGAWGWRARTRDHKDRESLLELKLDRDRRRWITRNLEGPSMGAEIWTHVFVTAPRELDIVVDYFVPGVPEDSRGKVGMAYARAYETLYDEDVEMMTTRQRQLDERIDSVAADATTTLALDDLDALPGTVTLSGRSFYLNRLGDEWVLHPQACPHQLGPLPETVTPDGTVTCPWHGYVFDVRSGACLSGPSCRFGERPEVRVEGRTLHLSWPQTRR